MSTRLLAVRAVASALALAVAACSDPVVLLSVAVTPPTATIAQGTSTRLVATAAYSDGTTLDVSQRATWSVEAPTVASVVAQGETGGVVTGVAAGASKVTATFEGRTGESQLTVTAASLTGLSLTPPVATLGAATTRRLTATGTFSDGSTQDLGSQVAWSTSDATLATVDGSGEGQSPGLVRALKKGVVTITATLGTVSASAEITVTEGEVVSVAVAPATLVLARGMRGTLAATATYADGSTEDVTSSAVWSSNSGTVAGVANREGGADVVAVGLGSATITATFRGKSGQCAVEVTAATLTGLVVSPATTTLAAGGTYTLAATGTYSDGTQADVTRDATWVSSDTTVAVVSNADGEEGRVHTLRAGSATFTAIVGTQSGTASVVVTDATLVSIEVEPAAPSIPRGTTLRLVATGLFSDGSTRDVSAEAGWSSAAPTIATVVSGGEDAGLVTGVGIGSVTLTAALDGKRGNTRLTVTSAVLVGVALAPAAPSIALGTSVRLTATGSYSDGTTVNVSEQASWASSDVSVATVSSVAGLRGSVSSVSAGQAEVSATIQGLTARVTVTVGAASVVSLAVTPAAPGLVPGGSVRLVASAVFSDGTTQDVSESATWSSSAPDRVSVSTADGERGLARGVSAGTSVVTAAFGGLSASATVRVTEPTLVSIAVTPSAPQLARGTTLALTATGTYSDGVARDVTAAATWSTSNAAVLSVSNAAGTKGLVTALTVGSANVGASVGAVSGSASVGVTSAQLVAIRVTPANGTGPVGGTQQFIATGSYSDATEQVITQSVTWSTSDPGVASISNAAGSRGLLTSLQAGAVTVSAALSGISGDTGWTASGAALSAISITPASPSVAAGTSIQLEAEGTYSDGTTRPIGGLVTWSSAAPSVAVVSNAEGTRGLLSGVATGSARITATLEGRSVSVTAVVTPATLSRIAVVPSAPTLAVGSTLALTVAGTFNDGSTQDLTSTASFLSSDVSVVSVSNSGATRGSITAIGPGSATVRAVVGGFEAVAQVQVTAAALVSLSVTPATLTIARDTPAQLTANGLFSDGVTRDVTATVSWTSSDESVAVVSNTAGRSGLVLSRIAGNATVTASLSGRSATAALTVTTFSLESIVVTPATASIAKGLTRGFVATGNYTNGATRDLTAFVDWTASPASVASVESGAPGQVLARSTGSATVAATFAGRTGSAGLTVTAPTPVSLAITPADATVVAGRTVPLTAHATLTDGSEVDVTATATWRVLDAGATVGNTGATGGVVRGVAAGTSTVEAAYEGRTATVPVVVTPATLESMVVSFMPATVAAGRPAQALVAGTLSDGTAADVSDEVTWSVVSGPGEIDADGLVTTTGPGSVRVRAALGSVLAEATLVVGAPVPVSLAIVPSAIEVVAGRLQTVAVVATMSDDTEIDVTAEVVFATGDASVMTVGAAGAVRGLTEGTATLTATLDELEATAAVSVLAAELESIAVSFASASVPAGRSGAASAEGSFSDGSTRLLETEVTWAVASGEADVDATGSVLTRSPGAVVVRASVGPVSATGTLTVTAPVVDSVSIVPSVLTLALGRDGTLSLRAALSDGTSETVGEAVAWASDDDGVATVSGTTGTLAAVTSVSEGTTSVQATFGAFTAQATVTVTESVLESIRVTPVGEELPRGLSVNFTATGVFSDGTERNVTTAVEWESSDITVATVSNGVGSVGRVTAVGLGSAVIRALAGTTSGSTAVSVIAPVATGLAFSFASLSLPPGVRESVELVLSRSDGSTEVVTSLATFESDDTGVASIEPAEGGLRVSSVAAGAASIGATFGSLTATLPVTVRDTILSGIAITPHEASRPAGTSVQFTATGTYTDETTFDLTGIADWASSDDETATIDASGRASGIEEGVATVTATHEGISGTATLTVTRAVLSLLSLSESTGETTVPLGRTLTLVASGVFGTGPAIDVTAEVDWATSDDTVATVSGGVVTPVSPGNVTITASLEGRTATFDAVVSPAAVESLSASVDEGSIVAGTTANVTVEALLSDGSTEDVTADATFASSDDAVATVVAVGASAGRVTGVSAGSVVITATYRGETATVDVSVEALEVVSLSIEPPPGALRVGDSGDLVLIATYNDGVDRTVSALAAWTSSDEGVVTVVASGTTAGRISAVAAGSSTITASLEGQTAEVEVVVAVTEAALVSIEVTPGDGLAPGDSVALTATGTFDDGSSLVLDEGLSWSSSDDTVATVDAAGTVNAIAPGTVTITVTSGSVSAAVVLTVSAPELTSIAVEPDTAFLLVGGSETFEVTGTFDDGSSEVVSSGITWTSSAPEVASVDAEGVVTALAPGEAVITAAVGELSATASVTVDPVEEEPTPEEP